MRKKKGSVRAGIALLVLICIALSGCKSSPVLTEIVYDDDVETVDSQTDLASIHNSAEHTDPDEDLPPKETDETAGDPRDREHETPLPDEEEGGQEGTAPDVVYDSNANSDLEAGANSTGGDSAAENTEHIGPAETEENIPHNSSQAVRQVVDASGRVVDLPTQIQSVSAVGEAAVLVCMLGGGEKLTAASESLRSGLAGQILSAPNCAALWSGSGTAPLSDAGFEALLSRHPQVCFEISGQNTFSDRQIEALGRAGIAYVVLPALTSGTNICQAVRVVGKVLGGDAEAKAEEYVSFYQRALNFVDSRVDPFSPDGVNYDTGEKDSSLAAGNGVYTLFIGAWDPDVRYTLHDDAYVSLKGSGLPAVKTGYTASPVSYFLSRAGVANSAALAENCYSTKSPRLKYVNPVISSNKALSVTGGTGAGYDTQYVFTSAGGFYLGQPEFSSVIVADEAIKENIERSPLWKNYGQISSATGLTSGYGFLDQNGDIVATTIHGDYDIFVLPAGVGSWADGSAESVLTSVWAAWCVRNEVTQAEVKSFISDFYQQFYSYTLSDAQMDSLLLNGK